MFHSSKFSNGLNQEYPIKLNELLVSKFLKMFQTLNFRIYIMANDFPIQQRRINPALTFKARRLNKKLNFCIFNNN